MADVERGSILVDFIVSNVKRGSVGKVNNIVDRVQIQDVQAWNTKLST